MTKRFNNRFEINAKTLLRDFETKNNFFGSSLTLKKSFGFDKLLTIIKCYRKQTFKKIEDFQVLYLAYKWLTFFVTFDEHVKNMLLYGESFHFLLHITLYKCNFC